MKSIFSFSNPTVWVIGGAGYLGSTIVKELLEQDCRVVCTDIEGKAMQLARKLNDQSALIPMDLDARNQDDIDHFVREQINKLGPPSGLVVLTYGASGKKLEEMTSEDFDRANQLGVTAPFLLAREVGKHMEKAGKGSIVLFSSMYGMVSPDPYIYESPMDVNPLEYGVGKAGIIQMTKYLAVQWAESGIRVNCISPGPFPNEEVKKEHPDFIKRLSKKVPMGRTGAQHEIAGPVLFLLSDASSYITGHNLIVDGGWTVW